MNASSKFLVVPRTLLQTGIAEHIEKFGVPSPDAISVELTATLRNWEACCVLRPCGSVMDIKQFHNQRQVAVRDKVAEEIKREFLSTGAISPTLDVNGLIEAVMQECESRSLDDKQIRERLEADLAAKKCLEEEIEATERTAMAAWVTLHGSNRLKRSVREGIECKAIYIDERLSLERPGWCWYSSCEGKSSEPRNPTESVFTLLDEARKFDAEATLSYHVVEAECDEYGDESQGWRGYTCESTFLGKAIVYGLPKEFH